MILYRVFHHPICTGLGTMIDELHYLLPPGCASFPCSLPFPIHCSPYSTCSFPKAAPGQGRDRDSEQQWGPSFLTSYMRETFTRAADQHLDLETHHKCGSKGHAMNPTLPVPSFLSPAREVRLLQTSLRLSLGPCGQLGPLHQAKSHREQLGRGAWGGRSYMQNGARVEGGLPAPSGQPTNGKGHGRLPGYRNKGHARGRQTGLQKKP